jgi:hypothetical protein
MSAAMPRYKTSVEEEPHQTPTVAVTTVDDRLRSRKSRTGPQQHQQYLPASNDPHRDAETRHSTSSAPPVHLPLYSPMMVESSADARWWMWWWRWCSCERSVPWFRSAHVQIRHVAHRIRSSPSAVRILDWIRRHIYLVVFSLGFLLIQLIYNPLSARRIDHQLTFAVMSRYFAEQQRHLQSMGVMLPPVKVDFANVINTHAALREVLIRRQARMRTLQQLELNATAIQSNCLQASTCRYMVPRVLFVPGVLNWESTRPGRLQSHNVTILTFDDTERQRLVQVMSMLLDHSAGTPITAAAATSLSTLYHQMTDEGDKILLWSLCAVYAYGGYFVGNYLDLDLTRMRLVEDILLRDPNDATIHPSPVAVLLLESGLVSKRNDNIRLLAASPRSGALGCLLVNLLQFVGCCHLWIGNKHRHSLEHMNGSDGLVSAKTREATCPSVRARWPPQLLRPAIFGRNS